MNVKECRYGIDKCLNKRSHLINVNACLLRGNSPLPTEQYYMDMVMYMATRRSSVVPCYEKIHIITLITP